jgi:hypothetical protein
MGTGILSLLEKWPRREADNSPPSTVEVTNVWSYVWTSTCTFMVWCVIKHRDFRFTISMTLIVQTVIFWVASFFRHKVIDVGIYLQKYTWLHSRSSKYLNVVIRSHNYELPYIPYYSVDAVLRHCQWRRKVKGKHHELKEIWSVGEMAEND